MKYTIPLKSSVQAIFVTKLIHVEIQEHPSASETPEVKFSFKSASPTTLQVHKSLTGGMLMLLLLNTVTHIHTHKSVDEVSLENR